MVEPKQPEDRVWVAFVEKMAIIRVEGRGSFKVGTALKQFGQSAAEQGCVAAVLDMTSCVGMDSTFMGVLAGMATRLKERNHADMVMLNLTPRTRGLVATLGLDRIVRAYQAGETPDAYKKALTISADLSALRAAAGNQLDTAQTMLEAHESLVNLSADNLPRFKDVLTFLREDVQKKSAQGAES